LGFFDEFQDTSGGNYVGKDEKAALMEAGASFPIVALKLDDHPQHGERFVATVLLPEKDDEGEYVEGTQEERLITFPYGTVESRDRMLTAMVAWLEDPANEPPVVKLEKVGRSIIVRPAEQ
jgi:hypothetical protein